MAAKCSSDACQIAVAGFRALVAQGGGGNQAPQLAPPPAEPSFFDRTLQVVTAFSPLAADAVQYAGVVQSNRTARYQAQTNATVQIAQTNAWSNALTAVGTKPSTSINVTGDYTNGGDHISNSGTYNTGSGNRFSSPNTGGTAQNCPGGSSGAGGTGAAGGAGGAAAGAAGGAGAASGPAGASNCVGGSAGG
jgi:hypothetical protein